jgi:hypothetical protein
LILYKPLGNLYTAHFMVFMNSTTGFHRDEPIDLMKEFTICESFSREDSPYAVALQKPRSYGAMVGDFLSAQGLLRSGTTVCELGGGYGSLMRGLLGEYGHLVRRVYMVDLSRRLLKRQRQSLLPWRTRVFSIQADAHGIMDVMQGMDLLIMNEVMGDLDTLTEILPGSMTGEAARVVDEYGLEIPGDGPFCLNIGAIRLVEAICRRGIPAFLSEHSCDPIIPEDMRWLEQGLALDSFPREIRLYRHSEYTIRFSHLVKVAKAFGKTVRTGALLDLIPLRKTADLRMIFTMRACSTERYEILYELLDHIREYRWMTIV